MIFNLIGQRFGRLTVTKRAGSDKSCRNAIWECKCDCGSVSLVTTGHLTSGHTRSCGCLKKEIVNDGQFKQLHGKSHSRQYSIWAGMKARCSYPKDCKYHLYGGRGITVCDEWRNSFKAFYDWAMANGYRDDLTHDRIDSNGNYEPSNCRWATYSEQNKNRRKYKRKHEGKVDEQGIKSL